ncbi:hypothetical protein ACFOOK_02645 [Micromonospora krabiensis]|uniref:Uncharacterized protein n=1 Tax=Micromonospora krabiensis TaxID=307121 RepID=A0A1C3MWP5_9ACTN|nr:hypothetical protein [Micromonospora krabiensis]SBV24743.1 hypothetical protein GA0070620_0181 [Micromonospora krabiensis]
MNLATLIACATCGYGLTEEHDGDHVTYRHPVSEDGRHQPVPVAASLLGDVYDRCHICSAHRPVWCYRTAELEAQGFGGSRDIIQTYTTRWHVCLRCAQHIEADDPDGLTATSAAHMRWHPTDPRYAILAMVHRAIILTRDSRRLLTTTDWPPAKLSPDMLPKIRDRLTGLLRGPADLPAPLYAPDTRRALADDLDRAPLYWVNQEFTDLTTAVTRDQPPAPVTDRIAPSLSGIVAWPQPVGAGGLTTAISWTPQAHGWHMICYRSIGGGLPEDLMPALRHDIGWLVPIHSEHVARDTAVDGDHPLGPLITCWLLMNQQMAEAAPAALPKAVTKAHQRRHGRAPDVRLVRITPPAVSATPPRGGAEPTRAAPAYRYWVSGHERNQAYGPGRRLRKKVIIEPFLKGPDDKPIKLSTTVRLLGRREPTDGLEAR